MSERAVYRLLEQPWIYRLSQVVLAPGAQKAIVSQLNQLVAQFPPAKRLLDVGCGPTSWLWRVGLHPVGIDLSPSYSIDFKRKGGAAVTGSAALLPFADNTLDSVWCMFMLHHLPNAIAQRAVSEIIRVCRPNGYAVIFDGVLPKSAVKRPIAWSIRRLDRGGHFREEIRMRQLLNQKEWNCRRFTYSATGLEGLVCVLRKGAD